MFEVATKHYSTVELHTDLLAIAPTPNSLTPAMELAKMADVTFYPGHNGNPYYLELPEQYSDREAMMELATELGLTWWENWPVDPDYYDGIIDDNDGEESDISKHLEYMDGEE